MSESGTQNTSTTYLYLIISIFTLILFSNTWQHEYVLDDELFITAHPSVQKGWIGIPEIFANTSISYLNNNEGQQPYRPLTLTSFAIENALFENNSGYAHLINTLLFAFIGVLIFKLLRIWMPESHPYFTLAIVLLFMAHPIHTEVICNVKSRDEILTMLFGLASLILFSKYSKTQAYSKLIYSAIFLFLACLSKENGITWLAIFPLALYFFEKKSIKKAFTQSALLLIPVVLFMGIWYSINNENTSITQPDIINNILFSELSLSEKLATKISLIGYYLELLIFPFNLSWDYSFNQLPIVNFTSFHFVWPFMVLMGCFYFVWKNFAPKNILVFWILFFAATLSLSSNLLFEIGSTLAERFLFIPSLAFSFISVWSIYKIFKADFQEFKGKNQIFVLLAFSVLFSAYSAYTYKRNQVWANNITLAESGVISAPNSARTHFSLAVHSKRLGFQETNKNKQQRLINQTETSFLRCLEIYPEFIMGRYNYGVFQFETGRVQEALQSYQQVIEYMPNHTNSLNNIGLIYFNLKDYDTARMYFLKVLEQEPNHSNAIGNLGAIEHNLGNIETAISYYKKSLTVNPNDQKILQNIVIAFDAKGDTENAQKYQPLLGN